MPEPQKKAGPVSKKAVPGTSERLPIQKNFDEKHPYYHIINQVVDPEVGVGIADMGIIYRVDEKDGIIDVIMTLTSMGCPAGPEITTDIDGILRLQDNVKDVHIEVVWDPPWSPECIKPEIRTMLWGGM